MLIVIIANFICRLGVNDIKAENIKTEVDELRLIRLRSEEYDHVDEQEEKNWKDCLQFVIDRLEYAMEQNFFRDKEYKPLEHSSSLRITESTGAYNLLKLSHL